MARVAGFSLVASAAAALTSLALFEWLYRDRQSLLRWSFGPPSEHPSAYVLALALALFATLSFAPGALGLVRLLRPAARAYADFAAAWIGFGLVAALCVVGLQGYLFVLAQGWREDPLIIFRISGLDVWHAAATLGALVGLTVGVAILMAWLARTRVVSPWPAAAAAILTVASVVFSTWALAGLALAVVWLGITIVRGRTLER